MIYNRVKQNYYTESDFGDDYLKFLYTTFIGKLLLNLFIKSSLFSYLASIKYYTKNSKKKILTFVKKHKINVDDYDLKNINCFNDFFIRKLKPNKREFTFDVNKFVAVADSKLMVYNIFNNNIVKIKNKEYNIKELIKNNDLAKKFDGGLCLVFRLTVDDYHRYNFFDNGKILDSKIIKGSLHTVRDIALKSNKVFIENHRICTLLKTENFGLCFQIEVGAILVGKIHNHKYKYYKKNQEKGYFSFGGSTIIVLLQKNIVKIDDDILNHCIKGIETKVLIGEKIGKCLKD